MYRNSSPIIILITALFMSGCATMSEEECVTSDWRDIGFEDGADGWTMSRFSQHREACAKYGITADAAAYRKGRDEGLYVYCQPERGYRVGLSGQSYNGVCHADLEQDFVDAHRVGHHLYSLRSEVRRVEYLLSDHEEELEDIEDKIKKHESQLIDGDITTDERAELLDGIKELSEDKGEIELEIKLLIDERARRRYEVTLFEQEIASYGY
jgi:hypothetical protein